MGKPPYIQLLFADNLHQHPLLAHAVELAIEYLFPGPEMQLALRNGNKLTLGSVVIEIHLFS